MKRFTTIALGFLSIAAASAVTLSPSDALERAYSGSSRKIASKMLNKTPVYTFNGDSEIPAAYVFEGQEGKGYTILSANDVAFPILGYSENSSFDPENIPPQLEWMLGEYSRQIEWASKLNMPAADIPMAPSSWTSISPMVATTWNQDAPYNNECPTPRNSSVHCYTGCVATSMAQVMNYFKYPEKGTGIISYTASKINRTLAMDFSTVTFDWNNMLNHYTAGNYTDTEANAVAMLMKACGYSVKMNYGTDASGATGSTIGASLRTYFGYDSNCHSEYRLTYSMTEWNTKIYENLKNIGPVIVNGRDAGDAGHSFVIDGYDGNGYYHLNWGWGGSADGYFTLDALNPDSMGIGGNGGGFNFGQNAIFGIQPNKNIPLEVNANITMCGNATPSASGSTVTVSTSDYSSTGFWNYSDETLDGVFGLKLESESNAGSTQIITSSTTISSLGTGVGYPTMSVRTTIPTSVASGKYKVTVMFKQNGGDWEPVNVPYGYNNFFYMEKSSVRTSVTKADFQTVSISKVELLSKAYYGSNMLFRFTLVNNTDKELTVGAALRLMNGSSVALEGHNVLLTAPANQTSDVDLVVKLTDVSGASFVNPTTYTVNVIDPETNKSYGDFGQLTLTSGPKTSSLTLVKLEIPESIKGTINYAGLTLEVSELSDSKDFDIDFSYRVRTGYFDGAAKLAIMKVDPEKLSNLIPVPAVDEVFYETPFLSNGEVSTNTVNVRFPTAEENVVYAVQASWMQKNSWSNLGAPLYFVKKDISGVPNLFEDGNNEIEFYNLHGIKVENPQPGQILIRRCGNSTEKIVTK